MINTQLEHVPIKEEVLDENETLEQQQANDSDETEETDAIEDEATLMISSDEEAELEAQRIRFHELVRFHKWVGKNLELRERSGRTRSSSSGSSIVEQSRVDDADVSATTKHSRKRHAGQMESCGNIFIYPAEAMLIFHCSFCDLRYAEMSGFAKHLHAAHKLFMESAETTKIKKTTVTGDLEIKEECGLMAPVDIPDPLESCGNVFVLNKQKLLLICGYCEYKYATLELFTFHLRQQHQLLERPIKEVDVIEPKPEVKEEIFVITMLPSNSNRDDDGDGTAAAPRPMVAIPPQHITLDQHDSLTMSTICCSSRSSQSSEGHTPPVRNSTVEETTPPPPPPPEEEETILPDKSTEELLVIRTNSTMFGPRKPGRPKGSKNKSSNIAERSKSNSNQEIIAIAISTQPQQTSSEPTTIIKRISMDLLRTNPSSSTVGTMVPQETDTPTVTVLPSKESKDVTSSQQKPKIIYQCDVCEKQYTKYHKLLEHARVHTGEKPFTCSLCGKQFRLKQRLGDHLLRHRTDKQFKCNICGIGLSTRADLALHQRHHNGDRRHTCSQCPKAFVRYSDLKIHLRVHTGEKPYSCEICEKSFRANQNLIHHRKTHVGNKPYKCELCDKSFIRSIDRKVHYRTHSSEKAFKCEICGTGYSSRVHVRKHIQRDHLQIGIVRKKSGPKPKHINNELENQTFKCEFCNKEYSSRQYIQKHKQREHKTQINNQLEHTTQTNIQSEPVPPPVQCEICNKEYSSHQNRQRHMKRAHSTNDSVKNKKSGPPTSNKIEKQKQLNDATQIQVMQEIQQKKSPNPEKFIHKTAPNKPNTNSRLKTLNKSSMAAVSEQQQTIILTETVMVEPPPPEALIEQQVSLALKIALEEDGVGDINIAEDVDETIQILEKENDTPSKVIDIVAKRTCSVATLNQQQQKQQHFQVVENRSTNQRKQHKITNYFTVRGQKTVT